MGMQICGYSPDEIYIHTYIHTYITLYCKAVQFGISLPVGLIKVNTHNYNADETCWGGV